MADSQFRRVVLKLSGEAFADTTTNYGIDAAVVQRIAEEVAAAREQLIAQIDQVQHPHDVLVAEVGGDVGQGRAVQGQPVLLHLDVALDEGVGEARTGASASAEIVLATSATKIV